MSYVRTVEPQILSIQGDNLPQFLYGGFSARAGNCIAKHFGNVVEQDSTQLIKFMKSYFKITLPNNNFKNGI